MKNTERILLKNSLHTCTTMLLVVVHVVGWLLVGVSGQGQ